MNEMKPLYTEEVLALMVRKDETVTAATIAPIVGMHPSAIIDKVKSGEWDQDLDGKYIRSGNRVKFYRVDFLRKHGFVVDANPDETKPKVGLIDVLTAILESQKVVMENLKVQSEILAKVVGIR